MLLSPVTQNFILLSLQPRSKLETILCFPFKRCLLTVIEHHAFHLRPTQGHEKIILIGWQETVSRRTDVITAAHRDGTLGELTGQIVFLIERISHFPQIIVLLATPSMGIISTEEPVFIKIRSALSRQARTETVNAVMREDGIHRSDVYL